MVMAHGKHVWCMHADKFDHGKKKVFHELTHLVILFLITYLYGADKFDKLNYYNDKPTT